AAAQGWIVQPMPMPAGASASALNGVSCPTRRLCVAVGYSTKNLRDGTLAERWNDGHGWGIDSSPNPPAGTDADPPDVACSDSADCMAVGNWQDIGGVGHTLAERWDGTSWMIVTTPSPGVSPGGLLQSVACPRRNVCLAVGQAFIPSELAVAERWDG